MSRASANSMYLALEALDSGLLARVIGIAWFLSESEVFCLYSWIYTARLLIKLLHKKAAQRMHAIVHSPTGLYIKWGTSRCSNTSSFFFPKWGSPSLCIQHQ